MASFRKNLSKKKPPPKKLASFLRNRPWTPPNQPTPAGFVPQKTAAELEAFENFGYFPEEAEQYVESILDSGDYLPENIEKAA